MKRMTLLKVDDNDNIINVASQKIDNYLAALPEWQRENMATFRKLIHDVGPSITEDWKWNVPVMVLDGKMIFVMAVFKAHTKYNFILNGALLSDDDKLFNNGFGSKKSRGIDLRKGDKVNVVALKALIEASIKLAA